jgi:serine/threonine protein kinase
MGVVFQAEDRHLRRPVALKVMRPTLADSAEFHRRFLREARLAAAIEHEHIVTVYQVGEDRGVPFLAMQLLHGETLEARLERAGGRLPLPEVLRVGREVAEGLAAAHAKGLIHRDIKPANVWLEEGRGQVRIIDFGLARGAQPDAQFTQAGTVIGTPAYMAPEQATGAAVDARCDLFSPRDTGSLGRMTHP